MGWAANFCTPRHCSERGLKKCREANGLSRWPRRSQGLGKRRSQVGGRKGVWQGLSPTPRMLGPAGAEGLGEAGQEAPWRPSTGSVGRPSHRPGVSADPEGCPCPCSVSSICSKHATWEASGSIQEGRERRSDGYSHALGAQHNHCGLNNTC